MNNKPQQIIFPQNLSLHDVVPELKRFGQKKFDLYTQSIIFEQKQLIQQACGLIQDYQDWGKNQQPIESCIRRFFQRHNINTQDQSAKPIEIKIQRSEFKQIIFKTQTQLLKFLVQFSQESLNMLQKDINSNSDYQMKVSIEQYLVRLFNNRVRLRRLQRVIKQQNKYEILFMILLEEEWLRQYIKKKSSILNQQNQLQQKYRQTISQSFIQDKDIVKIYVFQQINIALKQNLLQALNLSLTLTNDNNDQKKQNLSAVVKQGQQIIPAQFYNQLYSDQTKLNILMKISNQQSVDNAQLMKLTGKQDTKIILCDIIETIEIASELIKWEEILDHFMEKNLLVQPQQSENEISNYAKHIQTQMNKFREYLNENKQFQYQEPQLCNEDVAVEINRYIQQQNSQNQKPSILYKITQTGIQMMCQYKDLNYAASFSFSEQNEKFTGNIAQFLTEEIDTPKFLQIYFQPQAKAINFLKESIDQGILQQFKQHLAENIIHGIHFQLYRFTLNATTLKLWERKEIKSYEFPISSETFKKFNL